MNELTPPVGRSDIVVQSLQKNHRYILSNLHSSLTTIIPCEWLTLEMPRPLKKQKETSASEETKGSIKRSSCSSNNNDPRWQHLLRLQLNLTITNNQPKHHHHHQHQQQSTKRKTNLDNVHRPSSFFNCLPIGQNTFVDPHTCEPDYFKDALNPCCGISTHLHAEESEK